MFMGIAEINAMDGQGTQQEPENTKEVVYKFMEEEMQFRTRVAASDFKKSTEWESLSKMALAQ